jgi:hypothetical protein
LTCTFTPAIHPPVGRHQPTWYFAFQGRRLLLFGNGRASALPGDADLRELAIDTGGAQMNKLSDIFRGFAGALPTS